MPESAHCFFIVKWRGVGGVSLPILFISPVYPQFWQQFGFWECSCILVNFSVTATDFDQSEWISVEAATLTNNK